MNPYEVICAECSTIAENIGCGKSFSDADWHNTMTGHDVVVLDSETLAVLYATSEEE
jgi:hypothetical protein